MDNRFVLVGPLKRGSGPTKAKGQTMYANLDHPIAKHSVSVFICLKAI